MVLEISSSSSCVKPKSSKLSYVSHITLVVIRPEVPRLVLHEDRYEPLSMAHFSSPSVVTQLYQTAPIDEYVMVGNDALFKCQIPSFVADLVSVLGWVDSTGQIFNRADHSWGKKKSYQRNTVFYTCTYSAVV